MKYKRNMAAKTLIMVVVTGVKEILLIAPKDICFTGPSLLQEGLYLYGSYDIVLATDLPTEPL